jgi:hypothetical protein
MARKTSLFIVSIFALVLTLGLASATISVDYSNVPSELSQNGGSFTLNITNTNAVNATDVNVTIPETIVDGSHKIQFNIEGDTNEYTIPNLTAKASQVITIEYAKDASFEFEFGQTYSTTLSITENADRTLTFEKVDFCGDYDNYADLKMTFKKKDVEVLSGYGKDDDYWYPMDQVQLEVTVEADDYDTEDLEIEWKLFIGDEEIDEGDFSISDLDKNDDSTETFTITLDEDIEKFDGEDATVYVRAIGVINDDDANGRDEEDSCVSGSQSFDVNTDKDFVISTKTKINYEKVPEDSYLYFGCGDQITINSEIWNIGTKDQDDVEIEIYSNGMEVYKKFSFNEIDSFDSEDIEHVFLIPQEMEEGKYTLTIEVFDEDGDLFENDEDDESIETIVFMVEGNCKIVEPGISAALEGNAVAGKEMTIASTITNKEDKQITYTVIAEGYETWAELTEITPEVIVLGVGESKDVTFKFNIKKDIEGEKFFNIQTMTDGRNVGSQAIAMNVAKGSFDFDYYLTKENLQIAGIILLNLILVIAIILVARKILKKK